MRKTGLLIYSVLMLILVGCSESNLQDKPNIILILADENINIVSKIINIMDSEHENSEWYYNPGETEAEANAKRKKSP